MWVVCWAWLVATRVCHVQAWAQKPCQTNALLCDIQTPQGVGTITWRSGCDTKVLPRFSISIFAAFDSIFFRPKHPGHSNPILVSRHCVALCTHPRWSVHVISIHGSRVRSKPGFDVRRFLSLLFDQPIWLLCHICSTFPFFCRCRPVTFSLRNHSFSFPWSSVHRSFPVISTPPTLSLSKFLSRSVSATSPHTHTHKTRIWCSCGSPRATVLYSFLPVYCYHFSAPHPSQEHTVSRTRRWAVVRHPLSTLVYIHLPSIFHPSLRLLLVRPIVPPKPRISPILLLDTRYPPGGALFTSASAFLACTYLCATERNPGPCTIVGCNLDFFLCVCMCGILISDWA